MKGCCALIVLAACGFRSPSEGSADAPPMFDDGGHEIRMWSFDTAAEWATAGFDASAMTIDPRGSLTPDGYLYGGLIARGIDNVRLWTHGDSGWDKLVGQTPTGAGLWQGDALDAAGDLRNLGISHSALTIAFEGEVFLQAGVGQQLHVSGDDIGFIQIAKPGTTAFTQIADNEDVPVTVDASGWFPVRVGWANADATGRFEFMHAENGGGFVPWTRDRIRGRASQVQGMMRGVYYHQLHGGGIGAARPVYQLDATPLADPTAFSPPLQGSASPGATTTFDWSARWAGQLYATMPGNYTFRVDSTDGDRLQLGNQLKESHWTRGDNGGTSATVTATLVEGWNDLVVDYNNATSTPAFQVSVVAAPDPDLIGHPLPSDRLRPVEPRGERIAHEANMTGATFGDNTNRVLPVALPSLASNEVVTGLEVTVIFTSQDEGELSFRVTGTKAGTQLTAGGSISSAGNGDRAFGIYTTTPTFLAGQAASGPWNIQITDKPGGGQNSTTIKEVHVTVHTSGGADQIARTASWTSPIIDNETRLFAIDSMTWDERVPAGAGLAIELRSCDQADCSDGAWMPATVKGVPPSLPAKRYLQARVEMTSDGVGEPELRSLMIGYRRDLM